MVLSATLLLALVSGGFGPWFLGWGNGGPRSPVSTSQVGFEIQDCITVKRVTLFVWFPSRGLGVMCSLEQKQELFVGRPPRSQTRTPDPKASGL